VLGLGFFQDRDVGIGVSPEGKEILVSSLRFSGFVGERIDAVCVLRLPRAVSSRLLLKLGFSSKTLQSPDPPIQRLVEAKKRVRDWPYVGVYSPWLISYAVFPFDTPDQPLGAER
jgi:hypothetical protein